jgi:transcriptional regulator of arginine metabolism
MIQNEHVTSQSQIAEMLERDGIVATQVTVSRDLDEIGAVKVNLSDGSSVYGLVESSKRPGSEGALAKTMKQYVVSISVAPPIIVVKTAIGSADVTCAALDFARMEEIAGTIAGEDTIFIAATDSADIDKLAQKLRELSDLAD